MKFVFQSSTTPAANRGVYLDDIVVTGVSRCDLAPYAPAGWSDPVVLSSRPAEFQSGLLYEGEPVYLHASVANWGPGTADQHYENMDQIDGGWAGPSWTVPELLPAEYYAATSIANSFDTIAAGWHKVTWQVNKAKGVPETNEWNNTWSEWVEWRPPEITIRGYL